MRTTKILFIITVIIILVLAFLTLSQAEEYYTNVDLKKYDYERSSECGVYTNEDLEYYKVTAGKTVYKTPVTEEPIRYERKQRVQREEKDVTIRSNSEWERNTALNVRFCVRTYDTRGVSIISCGHKLRQDGLPLTGYSLSERGKYW